MRMPKPRGPLSEWVVARLAEGGAGLLVQTLDGITRTLTCPVVHI